MRAAKEPVGLVFFPAFDWAIEPDHPEREERLLYTRDQIVEEGMLDIPGVKEFRPAVATERDIHRVHICVPSVTRVATDSHLIAAGGTMTAADLVLNGQVRRSFALLRPPGHHAMRIVHGCRGFCSINNEAVMIEHVRRKYGLRRIAVVDTDAHHADGTQDIYYNDPEVLHISLHQDGRTLYPGSGFMNELGGPAAFARTLNVPLPPGTGDEGVLYVMENLVQPVLRDFRPELVVNAAGQDNHYSDPLTSMQVTARGYARLTEILAPDVVVLEGGYSIEGALPYVNVGILLALAGLDFSGVREPDWTPAIRQSRDTGEVIRRTVDALMEVWQNRDHLDLGRLFGEGPFFARDRQIYYDTDEILEKQHEETRLCPDCPGYRVVSSVALRRLAPPVRVTTVLVPWRACPGCRTAALDEYERLSPSGETGTIYLHDPEQDVFEVKTRRGA